MPDIALCTTIECEKRALCLRYRGKGRPDGNLNLVNPAPHSDEFPCRLFLSLSKKLDVLSVEDADARTKPPTAE